MDAVDVRQFCQELPKVELHAHLNTSYSMKCLQELMTLNGKGDQFKDEELSITSNKEMDESFLLFTKIQKLVTTEDAVYLLTRNVIREFAEDNVKYLELRSTPKYIEATGMTGQLYIATMVRAVQDCEKEGLDIVVRILPSIDRRLGVEVAKKVVDLAYTLMNESNGVVIGVDFSGDPKVGNAEEYIPVFLDALRKGLKLALHLEEIPLHKETKKVLQSCAEYSNNLRIGHGTFLHCYDKGLGHEEIENIVIEKQIPIEVCFTSNLKTKSTDKLENHHFKYWYDKKHPVIICTDGKGSYGVSLSDEYFKAATTFNLSKFDLKDISVKAIDSIFGSDALKKDLKERFSKFDTL